MEAVALVSQLKTAFFKRMTSVIFVIAIIASFSRLNAGEFVDNIEHAPLILNSHDATDNVLNESIYELINQAQSSISLMCFALWDSELINILNQKANEGIDIQLIIDCDYMENLTPVLHPSIRIRQVGEGYFHHKIIVVDSTYLWLGSTDFIPNNLTDLKKPCSWVLQSRNR